jgi:hypothetical protein
MKVKDLIKHLKKLPQNAQVMLWEGFNAEYLTKIKISRTTVGRARYPNEKPDNWSDYVPAFIPKGNREYKRVVCIQGVNKNRKVDMR